MPRIVTAERELAAIREAVLRFFDACERHGALVGTHPEVSEAYQRLCELAHSVTNPRTDNPERITP